MTLEETILENVSVLPPDLKLEALHFVEFLKTKVEKNAARVSLKGIWANMGVNITEEDMREARNEMWRGYTKDTEDEK